MKKILFDRPVISILILYVFVIIILNYFGMFLPERNSFLLQQTNLKQVELTGKVINEPISKGDNQQFILEVFNINGQQIKKEKTLVMSSKAYNIEYGDIICVLGKLTIPQKPVFTYIFDYNLYLQREKIYTIFYQQNFELIRKSPNKIKQFSIKTKNSIEKQIDKYLKKPVSSVLKSMITGNKSALDRDTKENFIDTGLIHILVISGLHIGFCVVIFMFTFKLFCLKLKYIYLLTIPTLFFYTLVTGSNAPAVRAAIMASCLLITLILDRESLVYNALALSALIILILNPQTLFTASFQLSFFATLGIIYLYPKFSTCFGVIKNKYIRNIWDITSVTLSAQIALIPLLIFYFYKLSVISFILNLLIVPIIPVVIGLAFTFYMSSMISYHLALIISFVLNYILKLILYIINYSSNLSFAIFYFAVPSIAVIIFYYIAIYVLIEFKNNKKMLTGLFIVICVMLINPFKQKTFIKSFKCDKNITIHIREENSKNIIVFKKLKEDKYYFSNLEQYLMAQGICEIDEFYMDFPSGNIKDKLNKINIKNILKNNYETVF